jgi:hypothetical protein
MIVSAVMPASWTSSIVPSGAGNGGLAGISVPSGRQKVKVPSRAAVIR